MKKIVYIFLALFISGTALAQAPQGFNYQGVARDLSGAPLAKQEIGLQIAILQESATGDKVYEETHQLTTSDLGLFSIKIGQGETTSGVFKDIDWGKASHFVQVGIDETGGNNYKLMGTSELMSVPYALYAENGSVWNKNSEGINYDNGSVQIGDYVDLDSVFTNPDFRTFSVNKGTSIFKNSHNNSYFFIESGNKTQIPIDGMQVGSYRTEGGFMPLSIEGAPLILNARETGNVGIGTTEPNGKLHVHDRILRVSGEVPGLVLEDNSENGREWALFSGDPSTGSFKIRDNSEEQDRFVIDTFGRIGIGTENPTGKLEILDKANGYTSKLKIGGIVNPDGFKESSAHHISSSRDLVLNVDSTAISKLPINGRALSIRKYDYNFTGKQSSAMLVLDIDGNLGLGNFDYPQISRPKSKLHVRDGDIYIEDVNKGVIMTSPNGQCWRYTPDNTGQLKGTAIDCPN